jgi:hypothetical protein
MLENFGDELERKRLMAKKHTEARDGGRKKKKKRLPPPNMVSDGVIGGYVLVVVLSFGWSPLPSTLLLHHVAQPPLPPAAP